MKLWILVTIICGINVMTSSLSAGEDYGMYELRSYQCTTGKQADVIKFFSETGTKMLKKHQLNLLAIWVPVNAGDERVFSLIGHKDAESASKNWKAFSEDTEWKAAAAKANESGKLVENLGQFFLTMNDYSPKLSTESVGERVFELRTYISTENNLAALNQRFKGHTVELFKKHGMTNIAYFSLAEKDDSTCNKVLKSLSDKGKDKAEVADELPAQPRTLIYLLSHKSEDAAKESFGKFRTDEAWTKALKASEEKAGGPLTVKQGVKSLFLKTIEASPLK